MAVQYLLRVVPQLTSVIAARIGRNVSETSKFSYASSSTLIYWTDDRDPDFQIYVTGGTALYIDNITQCPRSRIMQCLQTGNGELAEDMLQDQVDCGNASPGQGSDSGHNDSLMREIAHPGSLMDVCQLCPKLTSKERIP